MVHTEDPQILNTYLHTPWSRFLLWEANRFSSSQEISRILWNPKVHCGIHIYPPPVPVQGHDTFLWWGVLSTSPNAQAGGPLLVGCPLHATAYSIYSLLPSILEAVPPAATWGSAMPWWQGPIYNRILNTVVQNLFSWATKHLGFVHHCSRDLSALLQVLVELLV